MSHVGKEPRLEMLQTQVQRTSTRTYDFLAKELLDTLQEFILKLRGGLRMKEGTMFVEQTSQPEGK